MRILSHMLRVGPWNRLALTIQWLAPKYRVEFEPSLLPPPHMPIEEGRVISKKVSSPLKGNVATSSTETAVFTCDLCPLPLNSSDMLSCLKRDCNLRVHLFCLASHFKKLDPDHVVPLEGSCPKCFNDLLWADLIRKLQGCYQSQSLSLDDTLLA